MKIGNWELVKIQITHLILIKIEEKKVDYLKNGIKKSNRL